MNCELILNWRIGEPELVGLYFVAVKYGEGAGEFQFVEWNGSSWALEANSHVLAFIDIQSFKNQLSVKWPDSEKAECNSRKVTESAPWEEV